MSKSKPVIAIVDDDASVRRALRRLLASKGLETVEFPSACEFLHALKTLLPDCLLLDVQMPELNGLDLQEELVSAGFDFPIIFITGFDDAAAQERALKTGALAFLLKPFSNQSLLDLVHAALGQGHASVRDGA